MFYEIKKKLIPIFESTSITLKEPFVLVTTTLDWQVISHAFSFLPEKVSLSFHTESKLICYEDYLHLIFVLPKKPELANDFIKFSCFLTKDYIIFIDDSSQVEPLLQAFSSLEDTFVTSSFQCLFHFLTFFLFQKELRFLEDYNQKLYKLEATLQKEPPSSFNQVLAELNKELLALHSSYQQLITLGEDLSLNETHILPATQLKLAQLFTNRMIRLCDKIQMIQGHVSQLREIYQGEINLHQNHMMKTLGILTAICLPFSLITGWYGMNFEAMPEFSWHYGYLFVILLCMISLFVGSRFFWKEFKRTPKH